MTDYYILYTTLILISLGKLNVYYFCSIKEDLFYPVRTSAFYKAEKLKVMWKLLLVKERRAIQSAHLE